MNLQIGELYFIEDDSGNKLKVKAVGPTRVQPTGFLGGYLGSREIDIEHLESKLRVTPVVYTPEPICGY